MWSLLFVTDAAITTTTAIFNERYVIAYKIDKFRLIRRTIWRRALFKDKISRAQVIDVSKLSGSQVKFGATVTVVDEDTEDEGRYQIVGDHEADVKGGRISLSSPLSRAMIGKDDFNEGVKSYLEKRTPRYKGLSLDPDSAEPLRPF